MLPAYRCAKRPERRPRLRWVYEYSSATGWDQSPDQDLADASINDSLS